MCMCVIHTSIHTESSTGSNISFGLWWRWHSHFLVSAGELHILLYAEKKLIWTSQIEGNESCRFCFLLCLLIVSCTAVYPTCCLGIPLTLAVYICRTRKETLVTYLDLKIRMINFSELMLYFCPVTLRNLPELLLKWWVSRWQPCEQVFSSSTTNQGCWDLFILQFTRHNGKIKFMTWPLL